MAVCRYTLPTLLQGADKEGVHGHQRARMGRFDVTLAELRAEALQEPDLLLGELELALRGGFLKAQQPLVLGQQPVALPHPANATRGDLDALQTKLVLNPKRAVAGVLHRVGQDRFLDLARHPVWMRTAGSRKTVQQTLRAVRLEVPADLVELLARVAHHLARPADVVEFLRQCQATPRFAH